MHIKERVTLTLDRAVTHRAKSAARDMGRSFSGMVETLLREATGEKRSSAEGFVAKWRGKFKLAERKGPRAEYLRRKYGL